MPIFTPNKCFGCKGKFEKNEIPKYQLMADGNNRPFCGGCYGIMGGPKKTNIIKNPPKPKKEPKQKKKSPSETLWEVFFG